MCLPRKLVRSREINAMPNYEWGGGGGRINKFPRLINFVRLCSFSAVILGRGRAFLGRQRNQFGLVFLAIRKRGGSILARHFEVAEINKFLKNYLFSF